jgi:hypothetical protein
VAKQAKVDALDFSEFNSLAAACYEFAFIAASLRFRGASAAPLRPIAFPLRKEPGY